MRSHPLVGGSQKEVAFIEHIDSRILQITRRYAKKFSHQNATRDEAPGYDGIDQCVRDLEAVFNIVWISGTRRWPSDDLVIDETPEVYSVRARDCNVMI